MDSKAEALAEHGTRVEASGRLLGIVGGFGHSNVYGRSGRRKLSQDHPTRCQAALHANKSTPPRYRTARKHRYYPLSSQTATVLHGANPPLPFLQEQRGPKETFNGAERPAAGEIHGVCCCGAGDDWNVGVSTA